MDESALHRLITCSKPQSDRSRVNMPVFSQDDSVNVFQPRTDPESCQDVFSAVLDVVFVVIPRFDGYPVRNGSELFPPDEHAMNDMLFPGRIIVFSLACKLIDVCFVERHESMAE
jgi:hypothetical protein